MLTCPSAEKDSENIRVRTTEGSIYTVDDVSDLLGIPRPTLYRYLREYSIPHLRQGGRIRIPEDSFDRIREARDLHKEGLGTESVRRQLREGGGPDTGELDRRLNTLHNTLEDLRGDLRAKPATGEVALSPVLQTILARQSLMLSAMFNLTGMVEDLLLNNGKTRKRPVARVEEGLVHTLPLRAKERGGISGVLVAEPVAVRDAETPAIPSPASRLPSRFGSLGRRRRRGTLAVLSALLLGLLLVLFLPTLNEDETATSNQPAPNAAAEQPKPSDERPAGAGGDEADEEGVGNPADFAATDAAPPEAETTSTEQNTRTAPDPPDPGGVPDVSGRPLKEAARTVFEAGYTVAAIRTVKSQEEPGTVTGTEPASGTEARPNASVVLTMSAGPTGVSSATAASAGASSASVSSASVSSASASSVAASASSSASASPSP